MSFVKSDLIACIFRMAFVSDAQRDMERRLNQTAHEVRRLNFSSTWNFTFGEADDLIEGGGVFWVNSRSPTLNGLIVTGVLICAAVAGVVAFLVVRRRRSE